MRPTALVCLLFVVSAAAPADTRLKVRSTISGDSTESLVLIQGERVRMESPDGLITLYQCDRQQLVQINPKTKAYRVVSLKEPAEGAVTRPSRSSRTGASLTFITRYADTELARKIRGLNARQAKAETTAEVTGDACVASRQMKISSIAWYTDLGADLSCADANLAGLRLRAALPDEDPACAERARFRQEGKAPQGFPLASETKLTTSSGTVVLKQETTSIERVSLAAELFEVPAEYLAVGSHAELMRERAESPAGQASVSTEAPRPVMRPSRSTRSGEPRPVLTRICISTFRMQEEKATGVDLPRLGFGGALNGQGFESVLLQSPAAAAREVIEKEAQEQGCSYIVSAAFKTQEAAEQPESSELEIELHAMGSTTPLLRKSWKTEAEESVDALFKRAAAAIADAIQGRH
jgi:hypothetical protein